jgi:nucleotide-binding universal stress UspA family protein
VTAVPGEPRVDVDVPPAPRPVVVGVEPGPWKRMTLAWAADEAARRHLSLHLVHCQGVPTSGYRPLGTPPSWEEWKASLHIEGVRTLEDAVVFAEARQPRVRISGLLAEGDPVSVLAEQARDAALLVLGSAHPAPRGPFSGSPIALPVLARVSCPVVVVPEPEHATQRPPFVVVGVDGSARSARAVDVAFEEASLRGAVLRAVHAWRPPAFGHVEENGEEGGGKDAGEAAAVGECRRLLSETVAGRTAIHPEVDLRHEVVVGDAVRVLADASEHALAVVVGARGGGGLPGALLGSVSRGLLREARCPVIAVPRPAA